MREKNTKKILINIYTTRNTVSELKIKIPLTSNGVKPLNPFTCDVQPYQISSKPVEQFRSICAHLGSVSKTCMFIYLPLESLASIYDAKPSQKVSSKPLKLLKLDYLPLNSYNRNYINVCPSTYDIIVDRRMDKQTDESIPLYPLSL